MVEREALEEMVREFVAEAADIPISKVGLDANLYTALEIDSLGAVSIFVNLAYTFGVQEPQDEEEYIRLDTPRKLLEYVLASGS